MPPHAPHQIPDQGPYLAPHRSGLELPAPDCVPSGPHLPGTHLNRSARQLRAAGPGPSPLRDEGPRVGLRSRRHRPRAGRLGAWRTANADDDPAPPPFELGPIQELLATVARCAQGWLAPTAAVHLLELAGIPHCPTRVVTGSAAAVTAAQQLGFGRQVPNQMLIQLRCAPLLAGHRGSPPLNTAALADVLTRLSTLAEHCPHIAELGLNPLRVGTHGAVAVDTAIRCGTLPTDWTDPVADEAARTL
jgi:hypothetical protein